MSDATFKVNSTLRTRAVIIAMMLGMMLGMGLKHMHVAWGYDIHLMVSTLDLLGGIFIKLMQMLVVPVVLISLICGCSALEDKLKLGRIGGHALGFYLITTSTAVIMALSFAALFHVGANVGASSMAETVSAVAIPPFKSVILSLFPHNPIASLAEGNMVQIIFFSIIFGFCLSLSGAAGKRLSAIFTDLNHVLTRLILMVMKLTPYGVFCLIAKFFSHFGDSLIHQVIGYFFVVVVVLLVQILIFYPLMLMVFARLSPWVFFRNLYPAMVVAFSVASSNVSMPFTLQLVKKRLGVKDSLANFIIPLGTTINMDGTAIMQGVATVMLANFYHVEMSLYSYITVVMMAVLSSVGTAGVPGVGLVTLAMVLKQIGIPAEGIGLIIGVDRLLDMARTVVNISGDAMIATIIAKREGLLNHDKFYHVTREANHVG